MFSVSRTVAQRFLRPGFFTPKGSGVRVFSSGTEKLSESVSESHDDFKPQYASGAKTPSVHDHIERDISENPVMVYMKGVPEAPQCGFSNTVVRLLEHHGVPFKSRNVLADEDLRNGIKTFSQWPTVPQVYINGEFVGGSDILVNMQTTGELKKKLEEVKKQMGIEE